MPNVVRSQTYRIDLYDDGSIGVNNFVTKPMGAMQDGATAISFAVKRYVSNVLVLRPGVYNKAVFWPMILQLKVMQTLQNKHSLLCTEHYRAAADDEQIPWGTYKAALFGEVVECTVDDNGFITHLVTRLPHRHRTNVDLCFAIDLSMDAHTRYATVLTVWSNDHDDNHATLDTTQYVDLRK